MAHSDCSSLVDLNAFIDDLCSHPNETTPPPLPPPATPNSTFFEKIGDGIIPEWMKDASVGIDDYRVQAHFLDNLSFDTNDQFEPFYQRAYTFKTNLIWYYVGIRYSAWRSFIEDFWPKYSSYIHILPYWCLGSDGNPGPTENKRLMIWVLQNKDEYIMNNEFKNLIKHDTYYAVRPKFKKQLKPKNPMDLINCMLHVSNSVCGASGTNSKGFHHCIAKTLPQQARLWAMEQIPNGQYYYKQYLSKNNVTK